MGCIPHCLRGRRIHFEDGIMSNVVLEIKDLTIRLGLWIMVDALSLSVNEGEVFGLVSSNGTGKGATTSENRRMRSSRSRHSQDNADEG